MLKVVVVADHSSPHWSPPRIAREIVSNLEYEGFAAEVEIAHVENVKEVNDEH